MRLCSCHNDRLSRLISRFEALWCQFAKQTFTAGDTNTPFSPFTEYATVSASDSSISSLHQNSLQKLLSRCCHAADLNVTVYWGRWRKGISHNASHTQQNQSQTHHNHTGQACFYSRGPLKKSIWACLPSLRYY